MLPLPARKLMKMRSRTQTHRDKGTFKCPLLQTQWSNPEGPDPLSKPSPYQHLWPRTGVLRSPEYCLNPIGQYLIAHSYSSWGRSLSKNTNGLIWKYLPKSQHLNNVTQKEMNYIMGQLNHWPKETLGFKTPYDLFSKKNTLLTFVLHTWIRRHPLFLLPLLRSCKVFI